MPKRENMTEAQLANLQAWKWKPGQTGNPAGRPRNRVSALLRRVLSNKARKAEGLSLDEVNTIERVVLSLDESSLRKIKEDPETPAYLKTLVCAMLADMKDGRMQAADRIRSRQYGDVPVPLDVTAHPVSIEEIDAEIARLRELEARATGKEVEE